MVVLDLEKCIFLVIQYILKLIDLVIAMPLCKLKNELLNFYPSTLTSYNIMTECLIFFDCKFRKIILNTITVQI